MTKLAKKIFIFLTAVTVAAAVSGCSLTDTLKTAAKKEQQNDAVEQKETENAITIGVVDLDTYNPLLTKSVTMKNTLGFIYEPLFTLDEKQNIQGVLGDSYKISPDGKSITVSLKQNVLWQDGTAFSAKDVVYTAQTIMNGMTEYGNLLKNAVAVSGNANSVTVTFSKSIPDSAALLTFPIIKNGSISENFKPVGTGPFYLDYDKLSAFENYHGERAKIDTVKIKSVPDNEKFVSLFNAGVIDIADSAMMNMSEYTPRSNSTVNKYVTNKMVFVGFNINNAVFRYPEARAAIYKIIDRKNIVSHIYFSHAKAAHYPINPTNPMYPNTSENMHGDHGSAEKLLKDADWTKDKNGVYYRADQKGMTYFSVDILVNSEDTERIKIAAQLSETMSELGMKNRVTVCSGSEFTARLECGNYDMFIGKTSLLPNNDISQILYSGNVLGYSDEKTDILLAQIGTFMSDSDKKSVYKQLFERISEECPIAPICFLEDSIITSAKLKSGVCPSVSGTVVRTENWSVK